MSKDDNVVPFKPKKLSLSDFLDIDLEDAFENDPGPEDEALPGFTIGTVGLLASAGGVGKSFWGAEAAMCVASSESNKALLNLPLLQHGGVLVINAEDQGRTITRRIHKIAKHLNAKAREELKANFKAKSIAGSGLNLSDPELVEEIIKRAREIKCRLIILDTLSRLKGPLDENSNDEMGQFMLTLERIAVHAQASVLILHHINKGMAVNGRQDEQQSVRGAGVLVDNARWQAWMRKMTKDEANKLFKDEEFHKHYVSWGVSKNNNGAPIEDVWYRRADGGVLLPANFDKKNKANRNVVKSTQDIDDDAPCGGLVDIPVAKAGRGLFGVKVWRDGNAKI